MVGLAGLAMVQRLGTIARPTIDPVTVQVHSTPSFCVCCSDLRCDCQSHRSLFLWFLDFLFLCFVLLSLEDFGCPLEIDSFEGVGRGKGSGAGGLVIHSRTCLRENSRSAFDAVVSVGKGTAIQCRLNQSRLLTRYKLAISVVSVKMSISPGKQGHIYGAVGDDKEDEEDRMIARDATIFVIHC